VRVPDIVDKVEIVLVWKRKMKKLIKKIFGIDKIEAQKDQALAEAAVAEKLAKQKLQEVTEAEKAAELAKMGPKERATAKGEAWVGVLDTKVNPENVRNGFFELDWNAEFVVQLKQAGYGFDGDPEEEIVDRWFRDLAANMLAEDGQDLNRNNTMGFINISKIGNGKAEVQ
jgi:hypothetical protein